MLQSCDEYRDEDRFEDLTGCYPPGEATGITLQLQLQVLSPRN